MFLMRRSKRAQRSGTVEAFLPQAALAISIAFWAALCHRTRAVSFPFRAIATFKARRWFRCARTKGLRSYFSIHPMPARSPTRPQVRPPPLDKTGISPFPALG